MKKPRALKRQPLRIRLTIDDGLAAYLRAWVNGIGFAGDERETIIYLLRSKINDDFTHRNADGQRVFRDMMFPWLPKDIQAAWKADASVATGETEGK